MTENEHLLVTLMEESAEVIQATAKSLRFGLDDSYPEDASTNMENIEKEFIELNAVHDMLLERKVLVIPGNAQDVYRGKMNRVEFYMGYARERGMIKDA